MNLMIEQKENYSWVTQAGLHGLTLEGLLLLYIRNICQVNFLEIELKSIL